MKKILTFLLLAVFLGINVYASDNTTQNSEEVLCYNYELLRVKTADAPLINKPDGINENLGKAPLGRYFVGDCEVDSKGNIWYTMDLFHDYSKDSNNFEYAYRYYGESPSIKAEHVETIGKGSPSIKK